MTMVGAVGNILSGLSTIPGEIKATDLDPALIGLKLGGVLVEDGNTKTLELIAQSDIALITGMTLATRTLDGIIETAKANGTLMVMFNQTGSNFSQEFIRMGIHSVVSESYPFYMFSGSTIVRIYRAPLS